MILEWPITTGLFRDESQTYEDGPAGGGGVEEFSFCEATFHCEAIVQCEELTARGTAVSSEWQGGSEGSLSCECEGPGDIEAIVLTP